jgi:hypothetical protein
MPFPGQLGKRPERIDKPKVNLAPFLRNYGREGFALPVFPSVFTPPDINFPMDHNDLVGCCVVAGGDHALKAVDFMLLGSYVQPNDATLLRWYQTQNPGFKSWADARGPHDNGMVIADFLDFLIKEGLILAYGKIDTSSQAEVEAAVYLGLAIVVGLTLTEANENGGFVWDYVPGSREVGGHCVVWNGYWPPRTISWGSDEYQTTTAFIRNQVDEAYFILTQAHVDHPDFRNNFDLVGFAEAVKAITDGKVVVPTTPPVPQQTFTLTFTAQEYVDLSAWAHAPHWWKKATRAAKAVIAAIGRSPSS